MKDQYGDNIPQDLTLLDLSPYHGLTKKEIENIDKLDWYCFEGNKTNHIFVSASKLEVVLDGLIDTYGPDEFGRGEKLVKIGSVLHRWGNEGFYWA
jgi:hypothetical protein